MKDVLFARPELGTHDGLSYALFLPDGEPRGGVVILHGAGSAKESHYDFARLARAHEFAALAYDARGHGRSDGEFGPDAVADALSMCALVSRHAPALALRGSSLGATCAILAAAASGGGVKAVVAICPATEDLLLRGVRAGRLEGFRADVERLEQWLQAVRVQEAVAALAPRTALMLMHARGDEQVPYTVSQELYEAASEPKRLLLVPGGHHRSLQHDVEMQNEALRIVERVLSG